MGQVGSGEIADVFFDDLVEGFSASPSVYVQCCIDLYKRYKDGITIISSMNNLWPELVKRLQDLANPHYAIKSE
eukprot:5190747-Karenia_brevis.AAC.1